MIVRASGLDAPQQSMAATSLAWRPDACDASRRGRHGPGPSAGGRRRRRPAGVGSAPRGGGRRDEHGEVLEEERRVEDEHEQARREPEPERHGEVAVRPGGAAARHPSPPRGPSAAHARASRSPGRTRARRCARRRCCAPRPRPPARGGGARRTGPTPPRAPTAGPAGRPRDRTAGHGEGMPPAPAPEHEPQDGQRRRSRANRLFTVMARPRSSAVATDRRRDGSPLATSTVPAARAAVTPSDSMRLVVNRTSPLPGDEQSGQGRAPTDRRPAGLEPVDHDDEHHSSGERQEARRPERAEPHRFAIHSSGRKAGPWEEKTSWNGCSSRLERPRRREVDAIVVVQG